MVTSIVERALLRIPDRCEEIPCVSIRLRGGEPEPRELINTGEEGPMAEAFPSFDYEAARSGRALDVADDFNFAFDVVGKRGREKDKTALIAIERTGETVTHHNYSDLDQLSNRFANALMTLGAEKGDFAFVMIPRIVEWYQVLLGCTKTGVVAMPGTNLLTAKDIEYRINRADARLAIVTAEHAEKVEQIRANCPSLEHLILGARATWSLTDNTVDRAALPPTRADEDMLIYFTSGTTQMPKMVGRDHAYALAHSITGDYWMDLREDDVHWTLTDTGWAKAAWGLLYPPLLAGAAVVLYDGEGFDPEMHLKIIAEHRVTTFCAPPTIYRVLAQMDLSGADFSSLRHCFGAGEPLNPEAMRAWKAATGCDIYDGYGQTESINIVANFTGMEIRAGPSNGRRGDGGSVPQRLVLHRRHGDAGCGLRFVGRSDDIISSASYRISPFEVESALIEHEAVLESAVVAKPDEIRGEIVMAYITLAPGFEPSDDLATEIQDFVKRQTVPYKYPRAIEFRDALPKTISGKIRRVELREEAAKG